MITLINKHQKLLSKVDDKAGSGAGDDPKPLTADDIAGIVSKSVNAAIAERFRRFETKVDERFKTLESKKPAGDDADDPDAEPDAGGAPAAGKSKPGAGGVSPEFEQRLKATERRAEKAEKLAAEEKTIREKAVAEGRVREERAALQDQLTAAGVKGKMLAPAVAFLYGEQKKVKRTEDGRIVWAEGDDELDIAEGVKAWAKSEDGLGFMPARDVGGSGGTGSHRGGGGGGGQQGGMGDDAFVKALVGSGPTG